MVFKKGQIPWNIGLTKEIDERVKKYSDSHHKYFIEHPGILSGEKNSNFGRIGEKHPMFGVSPWNKNLTKETDERIKKFSENHPSKKNGYIPPTLGKHWKVKDTSNMSNAKVGEKNHNFGKNGDKSPIFGKHWKWSEEAYKNHIGKHNHKGEKNPMYHKGYLLERERNGNWLNGKSFEPYTKEFSEQFKEFIRQRDNLSCVKCNLFQDDHIKLYHRKLIVHHVDYIKENTYPENCCALCNRCNAEVNFNRIHWTKFFQSLLSERYGYKYSKDGKIIINLDEEIEKEKEEFINW